MNRLKKGPEIKLSGLKVPAVISDIYYELRERHLLPLVFVLLAAIVAVPLALSESPESEGAAAVPIASTAASTPTQVVVAKSAPGLRDYRKRLDHLREKDPFKQQFVEIEEGGGGAEGGESGEGVTEGGHEETGTVSPESTSPGTTTPGTVKYFSWQIDVRYVPVSTNSKPSKAKPTVMHNLPELSTLPNSGTPAAIFLGPTKDGSKALLLVSSNVQSVFGDAVCVMGGETCELLALEKGVSETFVYGENEKIFRLELRKLKFVQTDEINEAPIGEPNKGSGGPEAGSATGRISAGREFIR